MEGSQLHHATLTFERLVPASLERVFHALSDVKARADWGAPSDTAVILYDASDFRIGGVDRYRCGSRANPNVRGTTWYVDIIADKRIVSAERVEMDGNLLACSLATTEFFSTAAGETRVHVTVQVVSFVGNAMIDGHRTGHNGSLDNLVRYFSHSEPGAG
jgi:uncharacterized protein YndB with AHSA1/START domain